MHRFFCPDLALGQGLSDHIATLDRDESRHAASVLRLNIGDQIALFNGNGVSAVGCITSITKSSLAAKVIAWQVAEPPAMTVEIAAAIPKGPRADAMVQQLSQVGATRLIPLIAERSVVKPGDGKLEKFRRASLESAKQCGRAFLMEVAESHSFAELLQLDRQHKLLADATGECTIEAMQGPITEHAASMLVVVGPEGGWSADELAQAKAAGFKAVRLGPHIMRIETAAVVAAALCWRFSP